MNQQLISSWHMSKELEGSGYADSEVKPEYKTGHN